MTDAATSTFADRHVGPDQSALRRILDVVGVDALEDLAEKALPSGILDPEAGGGSLTVSMCWTLRSPNTRCWTH